MNIAIFGLGTIGSGVYELVKKLNKDIYISKIFDRPEKQEVYGDLYEGNIDKILNDPSIDLIVETLGGKDLAYEVITKALKNKKHVVTANKEVASWHFKEFNALAKENNVMFLFEASVGGGVPIIKGISNVAKRDTVNGILGVINGTCNFILTQIQLYSSTFEDSILDAINLGYAEKDPSSDLLGLDMVRKIAILTMLATNKVVDLNEISHMGIENLNDKFMNFVNNKGCVVKFVSEVYKLNDGKYHIAVLPVVVSKETILAQTHNENNTIFLECEDNGRLVFNGLGAGKKPTASAVLSDILDVYDNRNYVEFDGKDNLVVDNDQLLRTYFVIDKLNQIKQIENARLSDVKQYKFYALDKRTSNI
jgi:homoserine dehydrogenase